MKLDPIGPAAADLLTTVVSVRLPARIDSAAFFRDALIYYTDSYPG